jgi:hypothetical protein
MQVGTSSRTLDSAAMSAITPPRTCRATRSKPANNLTQDFAETDNALCLTANGLRQHAVVTPLVDGVHERVRTALPEDDYVTLVGMLARLAEAL